MIRCQALSLARLPGIALHGLHCLRLRLRWQSPFLEGLLWNWLWFQCWHRSTMGSRGIPFNSNCLDLLDQFCTLAVDAEEKFLVWTHTLMHTWGTLMLNITNFWNISKTWLRGYTIEACTFWQLWLRPLSRDGYNSLCTMEDTPPECNIWAMGMTFFKQTKWYKNSEGLYQENTSSLKD